jgi:hypothetical protein
MQEAEVPYRIQNTMIRQFAHIFAAVAVIVGAGCKDSPTETATDRDLATLRTATARYSDYNAAVADGYTTKLTDCMEMPPMGGMGFHFGKGALIDGSVAVATPEALLYEPQANGTKVFVGVEYLIPYSILPRTATPPVLFGQNFKQNDTFQLWALHAWVGRDNPSGVFADWNPTVNCKNAPPA